VFWCIIANITGDLKLPSGYCTLVLRLIEVGGEEWRQHY